MEVTLEETRQWNRDKWKDYYADPQKFARVFDDYKFLSSADKVRRLSSSETARLRACEDLIDGKLAI